MNGTVTDVIVARSHDVDRLSTMVLVVGWRARRRRRRCAVRCRTRRRDLTPKDVMTISLGGAPGPRTGDDADWRPRGAGASARAGRGEARRRHRRPSPEMTLPDPKSKPRQQPKNAPKEAPRRRRQPDAEPQARARRRQRRPRPGARSGLRAQQRRRRRGRRRDGGRRRTSAAPSTSSRWRHDPARTGTANQGRVGMTTMKFTIQRDGAIEGIQVEKAKRASRARHEAAQGAAADRQAAAAAGAVSRTRRSPSTWNSSTRGNDRNRHEHTCASHLGRAGTIAIAAALLAAGIVTAQQPQQPAGPRAAAADEVATRIDHRRQRAAAALRGS